MKLGGALDPVEAISGFLILIRGAVNLTDTKLMESFQMATS